MFQVGICLGPYDDALSINRSIKEVYEEVYEFLSDHSDNASLAWYCKKCVVVNKKLVGTTVAICDQQKQMDVKVEQLKVDVCGKVEQLSWELQKLRGMISTEFQNPGTREYCSSG